MKTTTDCSAGKLYNSHFVRLVLGCFLLISAFVPPANTASPRKTKAHNFTPLTLKQIIRIVSPSIVRLTVLDSKGQAVILGSGFVVADDLIATNSHVVFNAHAVTANFQNGRSETVFGVMKYDFDHDLVIMRAYTHGVQTTQAGKGQYCPSGRCCACHWQPRRVRRFCEHGYCKRYPSSKRYKSHSNNCANLAWIIRRSFSGYGWVCHRRDIVF